LRKKVWRCRSHFLQVHLRWY